MERCTGNTGEVPACRRPSRTLAPLVSLAALSWPGHSSPSPDRPELSWIRVPARTGSKRWPRRGGKPRRGRRSDTGPVLWPHLAVARQEHRFMWRRRLAQSGRAVVSPRDVKLAPRSRRGRVKMLDVAIRVTATYPAKWLLAPVEGRHTSSARWDVTRRFFQDDSHTPPAYRDRGAATLLGNWGPGKPGGGQTLRASGVSTGNETSGSSFDQGFWTSHGGSDGSISGPPAFRWRRRWRRRRALDSQRRGARH